MFCRKYLVAFGWTLLRLPGSLSAQPGWKVVIDQTNSREISVPVNREPGVRAGRRHNHGAQGQESDWISYITSPCGTEAVKPLAPGNCGWDVDRREGTVCDTRTLPRKS